jgi:hypothetical protein
MQREEETLEFVIVTFCENDGRANCVVSKFPPLLFDNLLVNWISRIQTSCNERLVDPLGGDGVLGKPKTPLFGVGPPV